MTNTVQLREVLDALDMMGDEWSAYVHRKTGMIISVPDDAFRGAEEGLGEEDECGLATGEMIVQATEILDHDHDYLRLPDKFEIHEWQVMAEFCQTVEDDRQREELLNAIHGSGAFRRFKHALDRFGTRDQWFAYRDQAFEQKAIDWLESNDLTWSDERTSKRVNVAAEPSKLTRISQLPTPPPRPATSHKGTFGSVLVIAGSEGMSGAACLAGQAALHGGAGLVTVAIPRSIWPIVAAVETSYMTVPLTYDEQGHVTEEAIPALEKAIAKQTAVAIGPGLGQSAGVKQTVQHLYANCPLPLVLDADGLNAFSGEPEKLTQRAENAPRILTPHPGEFARLSGLSTDSIQASRERVAADFARQHQLTVVLKGAGTVISDGRRLAVNTTGNSGMATGGSGDVLTGLIAALLAQGMEPFEAAQLAAHLHGLAGDAAAAKHTKPFLICFGPTQASRSGVGRIPERVPLTVAVDGNASPHFPLVEDSVRTGGAAQP